MLVSSCVIKFTCAQMSSPNDVRRAYIIKIGWHFLTNLKRVWNTRCCSANIRNTYACGRHEATVLTEVGERLLHCWLHTVHIVYMQLTTYLLARCVTALLAAGGTCEFQLVTSTSGSWCQLCVTSTAGSWWKKSNVSLAPMADGGSCVVVTIFCIPISKSPFLGVY